VDARSSAQRVRALMPRALEPQRVRALVPPALERSIREAISPSTTAWWEVPDDGYLEIVDVDRHEDELARLFGGQEERIERQVAATLVRRPNEPSGPHTVEVRVEDVPVGRLPSGPDVAWSRRLAGLEERGISTRAIADVSYRFARRFAAPAAYIHLRITDDPLGRTVDGVRGPATASDQPTDGDPGDDRRARRDAERARIAARRAEREERADAWRLTGRCAGCGAHLPSRDGHRPVRAFCLACRPPERGVPASAYANRTCPYCAEPIADLPVADRPCPTCGAMIHVRWGPDRSLYLLQAADLPVLEDAWREWSERSARAG
jgi:hypothetical protein